MNLLGVHLPWYDGFNFGDYTDVAERVAEKRRENADARDPHWWAERLAEYNAHHRRMQTQGPGNGVPSWNDLDKLIGGERDSKGKHVAGTGLYGQVATELSRAMRVDMSAHKIRPFKVTNMLAFMRRMIAQVAVAA